MTTVYIVVRRNQDIQAHMVEIMRVCASVEEAQRVRTEIWDVSKTNTSIEKYLVDPK
jgi:hypothetical protein